MFDNNNAQANGSSFYQSGCFHGSNNVTNKLHCFMQGTIFLPIFVIAIMVFVIFLTSLICVMTLYCNKNFKSIWNKISTLGSRVESPSNNHANTKKFHKRQMALEEDGDFFSDSSVGSTLIKDNKKRRDIDTTSGCTEDTVSCSGISDMSRTLGYGKLNVSLDYALPSQELNVVINQATDIDAGTDFVIPNSYVSVYLLPDKLPVFKTKIYSKSYNPVWEEIFTFDLPYGYTDERTLAFHVYHYDRLSKTSTLCIGETLLPLEQENLVQGPLDRWMQLGPPQQEEEEDIAGDVCLALHYAPVSDKLTVTVIECKNLDCGADRKPYVKIDVYKGPTRLFKRKTGTRDCPREPYFNKRFQFKVSNADIRCVTLFVTVMSKGQSLGSTKRVIGQLSMSHNGEGYTSKHWSSMLKNPNRNIARWHSIV